MRFLVALCLVLLIPLAVTSTQGMIKRLGGARWRLLHRLVYVAGVLGVLHFLWLAKKGRTTPYYYAIVLGALLAVRLWDWGRRRVGRMGFEAKDESRGPTPRPSSSA